MDKLKRSGGSQPDIDSLIQTTRTATDDIGMIFGTDKYGILAIRRSKQSKCERITIGSGEAIDKIDDNNYNVQAS